MFRRAFLASAAAIVAGRRPLAAAMQGEFPPTRAITRGPQHHWFGYYDKLQFDPSGRYVLGMKVDFEHRSPRAEDVIQVGMVDLEDGDRWIAIGESRSWCWQQGCMLQWRPGSSDEVLWNDRQGDQFVCHIHNVRTGARRTIPHAIYCVSPDGRTAVSPDFRRINDVRPGYGYAGPADPHASDAAPANSGIFRIDLDSGQSQLILSLFDIARLGQIPNEKPGIVHYFNHLLFSPSGDRFIALHRWRYPDGSRLTRLLTATPNGQDIRLVVPNGYASHFIWRDDSTILAQSKGWNGTNGWSNFLFEDQEGGRVEEIGAGVLDGAGHVSYLPNREWILNDTYPQGRHRYQTPHLYHVPTNRRIDLGHFHLPRVYTGEWRVDTHPRYSPDGRYVCIDAPVEGQGRQMHLIDVSGLGV